ncbi:MAG: HNH endonuclease [Pirellulales bacterium]|nr:HNH endonuclease [Pirellulales bacterium]
MDQSLRAIVRDRAQETCEYCCLPQAASRFVNFHIEHVIARQHGGLTQLENLALACNHCNFHKGPNIASVDPESSELVPLYHPRRDRWAEHFMWQGVTIVGKTAVGRATARLLSMNSWQRLELRENLRTAGESYSGSA